MNAKQIKLIRRFVRYSYGKARDVEQIKESYKKMDWKTRSLTVKRMKEITNSTRQPPMNESDA